MLAVCSSAASVRRRMCARTTGHGLMLIMRVLVHVMPGLCRIWRVPNAKIAMARRDTLRLYYEVSDRPLLSMTEPMIDEGELAHDVAHKLETHSAAR
jgi:hypothetical protein